MVSFLRVVCTILVLIPFIGSANAGALVDTLERGPKTGTKIPSLLEAEDQTGETRDFRSLVGKRGLILQFYRPMLLCPTCEIQATQWSARATDFSALGYEIAAVSNDVVDIVAQVAERREIDFSLLADPESKIISAFGLIDDRYGRDSAWHGVALPMIFVIDANAVITHRFSSSNFRERPDIDAVLQLLSKDVHK